MPDTFFQSMLSLKRHHKNMNLRSGMIIKNDHFRPILQKICESKFDSSNFKHKNSKKIDLRFHRSR